MVFTHKFFAFSAVFINFISVNSYPNLFRQIIQTKYMRILSSKMIRYFSIALLLLLICNLYSCGQYGTSSRLDTVESLIESHPDSALSILSRIDQRELGNLDNSARYALLKTMALDLNNIALNDFDILQPAIDYYGSHGDCNNQLRTYYYIGKIYHNQGKTGDAMMAYLNGLDLKETATDTVTFAKLLVAQGEIFREYYQTSQFADNNLKAAFLFHSVGHFNQEISCLTRALDGAISAGNKSIADKVNSRCSTIMSSHLGCKSTILPNMIEYSIHFGSASEIAKIMNPESFLDTIGVNKNDIALGFSKIGNHNRALQLLNSANCTPSDKEYLRYLSIKAEILANSGDHEAASNIYINISKLRDRNIGMAFSQNISFMHQRQKLEKKAALSITEKSRLVRYSVFSFISLLLLTIWLYYRYRLNLSQIALAKIKEKELELQQDILNQVNEKLELEKMYAELDRNKQMLEAQNMQLTINQLENECANLNALINEHRISDSMIEQAVRERIEIINVLLANEISENESFSKAYSNHLEKIMADKNKFMNSNRLVFKALNPRFIEYMESHGMTETEINYACLYAIGLRGKEIGEFTQMKRHYNISSEIRKKLGITEHDTNLGIYVRKLLHNLQKHA